MRKKKQKQWRNGLEKYATEQLKKYNIQFGYESLKITLSEGFVPNCTVWEKYGKNFKDTSKFKVQPITYTPDFIGDEWIMETKGYFREESRIKWKLFKKWILENGLDWLILMPRNQKEVDKCITIIKNFLHSKQC